MIKSGDFTIQGLLASLSRHIETVGAAHVVIDALDVLLRIFEDPLREQEEIERLHRWLLEKELTSILTLKVSESDARIYPFFRKNRRRAGRQNLRSADIRYRRPARGAHGAGLAPRKPDGGIRVPDDKRRGRSELDPLDRTGSVR
ncbi:MAG: hypothetical protein K9K88_14730 [Desulfobacterales bacterium]|nr:hypothetical protein [Desulfobacterales bacterium]